MHEPSAAISVILFFTWQLHTELFCIYFDLFFSFVRSCVGFGFFDLFHHTVNLHESFHTNWIETVCVQHNGNMGKESKQSVCKMKSLANDAIEAEFTEFGASSVFLDGAVCIETRIQSVSCK